LKASLAGRLPYFVTSLVIVALDRATKSMIEAKLQPWKSVPVIPGLFDLTYVRNPGGVFGIFKNLDDGVRGVLFTVVPVTAILLMAAYAGRIPVSRRLTQVSLSLILGGAVGNLVDRFLHGHVIDFLDFYWRSHHWPAFNIADSAICVGVAMLMIETIFVGDGQETVPLPAGNVAAGTPPTPTVPPVKRGDAP
jgi:signal peptidase II